MPKSIDIDMSIDIDIEKPGEPGKPIDMDMDMLGLGVGSGVSGTSTGADVVGTGVAGTSTGADVVGSGVAGTIGDEVGTSASGQKPFKGGLRSAFIEEFHREKQVYETTFETICIRCTYKLQPSSCVSIFENWVSSATIPKSDSKEIDNSLVFTIGPKYVDLEDFRNLSVGIGWIFVCQVRVVRKRVAINKRLRQIRL